ncbi:hypothetical protein NIES4075_71970 [Tolypothrix sp. NIES-4075]|uniref:hypothetical protein n=1 Tax=Tolypothrix sp. NIES-4075 TaxID=2005459 RepID=UPI000B733139|nr:hypothetical protein [Tolypothrix sp. NIES-4075]GAX46176.1 hypothetical protein NIES4075_71970 [Tolypothrix sp. NIES-4075]
MEINQALLTDNASGAEVLLDLDVIASLVAKFKTKYPHTFHCLCEAGLSTGEMTLGDAESAFDWVANFLVEA